MSACAVCQRSDAHEIHAQMVELRSSGCAYSRIGGELGQEWITEGIAKNHLKNHSAGKFGSSASGGIQVEPRSGFQVEERDNEMVVTGRSSSVRSIEQLLDQINLPRACALREADTEWVVSDFKANVWETSAIIEGDLRAQQNWQIKANLVRRKAVAIKFEPLKPVILDCTRAPQARPRKPTCGLSRTLVVIPDIQAGFARDYLSGKLDPLHDMRAMDIAAQVVFDQQPNEIVIGGDSVDLPSWSTKFTHGPEFAACTQPALIALAWYIHRLHSLSPHSRIIYIEGNHEHRIAKSLMEKNLGEACALRPVMEPDGPAIMSIERLLDLKGLPVEFAEEYPKGRFWPNENVDIIHGHIHRGDSGQTAQAILKDARHSTIFNHLHRREMIWKTAHPFQGEREYMAACFGALCRIDSAVPAATPRVNWQQGCGVLNYAPGNGRFNADQVVIQDGYSIWRGNEFIAEDRTEDLVEWARRVGWKNAGQFAGYKS